MKPYNFSIYRKILTFFLQIEGEILYFLYKKPLCQPIYSASTLVTSLCCPLCILYLTEGIAVLV